MRKRPKRTVFPTSIRLDPSMIRFLRERAEEENRFNAKFGTGDISYMINEILEQYRTFWLARPKRIKKTVETSA